MACLLVSKDVAREENAYKKQKRMRAGRTIENDTVVLKVSDSEGATWSTTASNTRLGSVVRAARA